jgi:hypothetical protein
MNKVIGFFKESSPLKLVVLSLVIGFVAVFIEKPLPNVFMGLRLIAFLLFIYAVIRYFNSK